MNNSIPNWQHHSNKEKKRKLKPQALRQAKARLKAFKKRFIGHPKGDLFSLNPDLKVEEEQFQGTTFYYIRDFYEDPEEVVDFLFNREVPLWKGNEQPSMNSLYFDDRRLQIYDDRIFPVLRFLSNLCGQCPYSYDTGLAETVCTNMTRFLDNPYNNYENCIWWPHRDAGYNGIVYFNEDDDECGTNFYSEYCEEEAKVIDSVPEHSLPWRPRARYNIIKQVKPEYNMLVLFDCNRFPHGMNISNKRYFGEEYRRNQVFFMDRHRPVKELTQENVLRRYGGL